MKKHTIERLINRMISKNIDSIEYRGSTYYRTDLYEMLDEINHVYHFKIVANYNEAEDCHDVYFDIVDNISIRVDFTMDTDSGYSVEWSFVQIIN